MNQTLHILKKDARVDRVYALVQGGAPIQLSYSPDPRSYGTTGFQASAHVMVPVSFHLAESGVGEGYAVMPDAIRGEITAPDGSHWISDWQGSAGYRLLPGDLYFSPGFSMPLDILRKYQGVPLQVRLWLALTQAQAARTTTLALPTERFSVPGFGSACRSRAGPRSPARLWESIASLRCASHSLLTSARAGPMRPAPPRRTGRMRERWAPRGWDLWIASSRSLAFHRLPTFLSTSQTTKNRMGRNQNCVTCA